MEEKIPEGYIYYATVSKQEPAMSEVRAKGFDVIAIPKKSTDDSEQWLLYTSPNKKIKVGSIVKYTRVLQKGEEDLRFVVLEHNGDRLLVQALGTGMSIPGTQTIRLSEFEWVDDVTNPNNPDDKKKVLSELKKLIRLFIENCDAQVTPEICRTSQSPEGYKMIEGAIIKKCMSSGMAVGSAMVELDNELQKAYN